MKISIPKPCHENWNEMLPEDKGRFCLKCTKTVVDFSNQSKDQIKSFFKEATGKVCGRFTVEQVESPRILSFSILKKRMTKFAIALYLVFGGFLFSCASSSNTIVDPDINHVKGDVADVETVLQGKVLVSDTTKSTGGKTKKKKATKKACKKNTMIQGDVMIFDTTYIKSTMGEVMIKN